MWSSILHQFAVAFGAALLFRRGALHALAAADSVVCLSCAALRRDAGWTGVFSREDDATWRRSVRPRIVGALLFGIAASMVLVVAGGTVYAASALLGLVALRAVFVRAVAAPVERFRADTRGACPCERCRTERAARWSGAGDTRPDGGAA